MTEICLCIKQKKRAGDRHNGNQEHPGQFSRRIHGIVEQIDDHCCGKNELEDTEMRNIFRHPPEDTDHNSDLQKEQRENNQKAAEDQA